MAIAADNGSATWSRLEHLDGLRTDWDFVPSAPHWGLLWRRALFPIVYSRRRPSFELIRPLERRDLWVTYFAFCPNDRAADHQVFTLARLKDMGLNVFVICASSASDRVPAELHHYSDALCWKALSGYDFSAYTLALELLSESSAGATTLVLNDSMYGPFVDVRPIVRAARWDLTGFTASSIGENHIQSYAFIMKDVTAARLAQLRGVFLAERAYDQSEAVIWCQETPLARVAHQSMSVGSFLYCNEKIDDMCLRMPFELLDAGFPLMKRSLLGKMAKFQNRERVLQYLTAHGHPVADVQRR